ncbi:MAG: hypothetical protein C0498_09145 [Anaerolinea sp.]|nr:hypothetical protein [Anaerolinea sp.]
MAFPIVRGRTRIRPVRRHAASRKASRLASSMTDTGTTSKSGEAARRRSRLPSPTSSARVARSRM